MALAAAVAAATFVKAVVVEAVVIKAVVVASPDAYAVDNVHSHVQSYAIADTNHNTNAQHVVRQGPHCGYSVRNTERYNKTE